MIDEQYRTGQERAWKEAKMGLEWGKDGIETGSRIGFKRGTNGF